MYILKQIFFEIGVEEWQNIYLDFEEYMLNIDSVAESTSCSGIQGSLAILTASVAIHRFWSTELSSILNHLAFFFNLNIYRCNSCPKFVFFCFLFSHYIPGFTSSQIALLHTIEVYNIYDFNNMYDVDIGNSIEIYIHHVRAYHRPT